MNKLLRWFGFNLYEIGVLIVGLWMSWLDVSCLLLGVSSRPLQIAKQEPM